MRDLGVSYVYPFQATGPRRGIVKLAPDFYGGWAWDGAATGAWLADFLASPRGDSKLRKLSRATHAAERHLVVVLHPQSPAGLCIPSGLIDLDDPAVAYTLITTFVPPSPLTSLWLISLVANWTGLRWSRDTGWSPVP